MQMSCESTLSHFIIWGGVSNLQMRYESTKCSPVIGWWPEVLKLLLLRVPPIFGRAAIT